MSCEIRAVHNAEELEQFISLPWSIYPPTSLWVPPLKRDERKLLTPGRHPFWQTARRELFLALQDGKPVGRIAAIVDDKHNGYAHEKCGAFGFFECVDAQPVAHALLDAARKWLAAQGMDFVRGPLNPSTNYTCGCLVDGFDKPPCVMMPWNHPYYPALLESWGMRKEKDLYAYHFVKGIVTEESPLMKLVARFKEKGHFTCRTSSRATMKQDIRDMLRIYAESWAANWCFSPLSPDEAEELVSELSTILDPDYFVLFFHENEPVAGMVALPDMTPLLRRLNGELGLLTPWHWWRSRKQMREGYRIILFGIQQKFRRMGLPLLLVDYLFEKCMAHGAFQWLEGSWVLEDNIPINQLLASFSGRISKTYRLFRKDMNHDQA